MRSRGERTPKTPASQGAAARATLRKGRRSDSFSTSEMLAMQAIGTHQKSERAMVRHSEMISPVDFLRRSIPTYSHSTVLGASSTLMSLGVALCRRCRADARAASVLNDTKAPSRANGLSGSPPPPHLELAKVKVDRQLPTACLHPSLLVLGNLVLRQHHLCPDRPAQGLHLLRPRVDGVDLLLPAKFPLFVRGPNAFDIFSRFAIS
mmetsp:Transcript_51002/g.124268  ORF Transcript_51002/g.124268 Transcript_51002/m.124268 type:complete len:207 (-) Transcript_51002:528-1148(-)